ncbi:hypothetical protein NDU88_000863 [Pleurodeles waltl]|uniref:Uncharacterized protein n=1 Tax=Pleurodeles waltl TaxID=8319 RepID=A0AAV7V680_PLEWA|nr:hypothetical protein NDU88_000863 [Pleurodeles waltl]
MLEMSPAPGRMKKRKLDNKQTELETEKKCPDTEQSELRPSVRSRNLSRHNWGPRRKNRSPSRLSRAGDQAGRARDQEEMAGD